jgi:citrate synthase
MLFPVQACSYSSSSEPDLKETFKKVLPAKRELLKKVKANGDKVLGEVKVENTLGGMRCADYERRSTLHH